MNHSADKSNPNSSHDANIDENNEDDDDEEDYGNDKSSNLNPMVSNVFDDFGVGMMVQE